MRRRSSFALALFASAAVLGTAAGASAQEVEELIVTAERRETTLQKTPISIVALSTESLERKNIDDIADLASYTPNLNINGSRGNGTLSPTFSIRGISGGGGATSERGVGLYIDGIYVPRTSGSVLRVVDVERVEVLRGPQGTLFGRNSTGGAVRIFTKQPGQEFEGYIRGTLANMDRRDLQAMVNIPVNEQFAIRAQGAYLHQDGYVERGTQKLGGSEDWIGRLQARFEPSSNVRATFGFLYSDSKSDGSPADFETFDMNPNLNYQGNYADWLSDALALAGQPRLDPNNDPRIVLDDFTMPGWCFVDDFNPDWDAACEQYNDNRYWQADANVEIDLSDTVRLTSITGLADLRHRGSTDWQLLGFETRPDNVDSKVFYQELQLNAELFDGAVDLVTGGNYFHEKSRSFGVTSTRRGTSVFTPAGGVANGNGDAGMFTQANQDTTQISDSYGIFASGTWHMTDKANLTLGARWAHDKKDFEATRYPSTGDAWNPAPGTTSTTVTDSDDWTEIDWRGTLDYNFTPDHMAYATVSKAYRAGQYSFTILANVPGPAQSGDFINTIPPEKVINFEGGLRTRWFDGRLRLNPTAFYMKWSNRQAARQISCAAEGTAACPVGFRIQVVDSGDVDIYGVELDASVMIDEHFSLEGGFAITDYELKDPVANSGPNLFPAQASPSLYVGGNFQTELGNGSDLKANINYSYLGSQPTHPTEGTDSSYTLPGYGLVNGRITWTAPSDAFSVTLFGNNLFDKTYANFATRFGGGFWDNGPGTGVGAPLRSARSVVRGRPREVGVTLQYNFR